MTSLMRYQFRNLLSYCLFPGILPSPTMDRGRVIRLVLHSTAVTTFSLIASTTEPTPNGVYGTKFAMKGEFFYRNWCTCGFPIAFTTFQQFRRHNINLSVFVCAYTQLIRLLFGFLYQLIIRMLPTKTCKCLLSSSGCFLGF